MTYVPDAKKLKVLLVDDQKTQIMFERMLLGTDDFEFIEASGGREAVDKARSTLPDLILLDIVMPEVDGIEAARLIRKDPLTEKIPIIMVTTKSAMEYVTQAFNSGACAYVTKPIQKDELLTKIRSLTKLT